MTDTKSVSIWTGRVISAILVVALVADAAVSLFAPQVLSADMQATGFPIELSSYVGMLLIVCTLIYAIPQTALLGAILITGFMGGAICTHFRVGEVLSPPQLICLCLGALAWGGLYLRDKRLRTMLPLMLTL